MDERINKWTTSPSTACPPAGPTTICATPTPSHFTKLHTTSRVMNTQQEMQPTPSQAGPYHNPNTSADQTILLTSEEEILLQTCGHQYNTPSDPTPTTSEATPVTNGPPLMILFPNAETPLHIPHISLRRNVYNPQAREGHNYSLVDDLEQSPAAISVL
jgi:hypothetical protein